MAKESEWYTEPVLDKVTSMETFSLISKYTRTSVDSLLPLTNYFIASGTGAESMKNAREMMRVVTGEAEGAALGMFEERNIEGYDPTQAQLGYAMACAAQVLADYLHEVADFMILNTRHDEH